ncbi:energy transducer TonB [Methylobacterium sp. E-046]|jgi:hypothetical protein|uniref:energy transducer TonB n=1 Tax=Methylobacterium sp. E-046 TaxID=2836576 RepID=UPI001FBA241C|nr:energy transducer TonB [Methylobacterium sp. E-046]MCJ2097442.1 energy transducer TonB [Methylobacterium sp. E-046]
MTSGDPTPRLFAAAASLTGTGILMSRPDPSLEGILIGLLCLGLWALGTLAAWPSRTVRPARSTRPRVLEAVILEAPRFDTRRFDTRPALPVLLPAPRPAPRAMVQAGAPRRPEVPTHRQRVIEGHTRNRR